MILRIFINNQIYTYTSKNIAYRRHRLSQLMRIKAPIPKENPFFVVPKIFVGAGVNYFFGGSEVGKHFVWGGHTDVPRGGGHMSVQCNAVRRQYAPCQELF